MDHLETAIPGDPSHNQSTNADTIAYTSKMLGPVCVAILLVYVFLLGNESIDIKRY